MIEVAVPQGSGPIADELAKPKAAPDLADLERGPVILACIVYRQTIQRLDRLIASVADKVSAVLFVDGPFEGLSDQVSSGQEMYDAIAESCNRHGVKFAIACPDEPWASEPEKRTEAARMALDISQRRWPKEMAWVLVLDSDEWLTSDIDWDVVLGYGHGSGTVQSWRDGEWVREGGDGTNMVRLFPNTDSLLWGPAHFDVRDNGFGKTYIGWEKALSNEDVPAFTFAHDLGEKVIAAEYETYNDRARLKAEGKMMRTIETVPEHGRLVIRMDTESVLAGDWSEGIVVRVGNSFLGVEGEGYSYCQLISMEPAPDGLEAVDMEFELIPTEEEAAELMALYEQGRQAARERQAASTSRRIQKRMRKHDKTLRARRGRQD